MPGRYDTGPGGCLNPSDAAPERQRDVLRYIKRHFIPMLRQLNQVFTVPFCSGFLMTFR